MRFCSIEKKKTTAETLREQKRDKKLELKEGRACHEKKKRDDSEVET